MNQFSSSPKGIFTISLDFELHWGCLETKPILDEKARNYFLNTRRVIPRMLELFQKSELHVTWATVGMLFCETRNDWQTVCPTKLPAYADPKVSSYAWIEKHGFTDEKCLYHFAPELIEQIKQTPFQEIGTHTFSHFFCQEPGQTDEDFRNDLLVARLLAEKRGITLHSLVFPRNQFRENYLDICRECGIQAVRSNPDVWYWTPVAKSGIWRKLFRTADAYLPFFSTKSISVKTINPHQVPLQLPASRLYRPWQSRFSFLNTFKINRIKQEMKVAAIKGECYHLWWHPHNLGTYPEQCLKELEEIIAYFHTLQDQYGMKSMNMADLTTYIKNEN